MKHSLRWVHTDLFHCTRNRRPASQDLLHHTSQNFQIPWSHIFDACNAVLSFVNLNERDNSFKYLLARYIEATTLGEAFYNEARHASG